MPVQTITTPSGDTLVILPLSEYEALRDARDAAEHRATMEAAARGEVEWLSAGEAKQLLAAKSPLAFWRRKRNLTQAALADAAGISQSYVAGLESGDRKGDPALIKRLASALAVRMEDLVED